MGGVQDDQQGFVRGQSREARFKEEAESALGVKGALEEAVGAGGAGQASEQAPEWGDGVAVRLEAFGEGGGGVGGLGASVVRDEWSEELVEVECCVSVGWVGFVFFMMKH